MPYDLPVSYYHNLNNNNNREKKGIKGIKELEIISKMSSW